MRDHRARAFQRDDHLMIAREAARDADPIRVDRVRGSAPHQSGHLAGVRREYQRHFGVRELRGMSVEGVQGVGIDHAGLLQARDQGTDEPDGLGVCRQARPNRHGAASVGEGEEAFQSVHGERLRVRLRHRGRHDFQQLRFQRSVGRVFLRSRR